mgnify:CR=1 FL=1|jgi:hypothetical protein
MDGSPHARFCADLDEVLSEVREIIVAKNEAYGDSVLTPVRCFAKQMTVSDGISVRLDDKISRLMRGQDAGEDPKLDLIGYLLIDRIAKKRGV